MRSRKGFASVTTIVFGGALSLIVGLSLIILIKNKQLEKKDETIRIIKTEKIKDDVVSENNIFYSEHSTIGKLIPKQKAVHEEVNVSIGNHSIKFK